MFYEATHTFVFKITCTQKKMNWNLIHLKKTQYLRQISDEKVNRLNHSLQKSISTNKLYNVEQSEVVPNLGVAL
jgi:hypothetical protein